MKFLEEWDELNENDDEAKVGKTDAEGCWIALRSIWKQKIFNRYFMQF